MKDEDVQECESVKCGKCEIVGGYLGRGDLS